MRVVQNGEREFIVMHRPKNEADYRYYVSSRYCYAYLTKQAIWKHAFSLAPQDPNGNKIKRLRKAVTMRHGGAVVDVSTAFAGLTNGMRQDDIGKLALTDSLILQLGKTLCRKFGGNKEQFSYIRSKMRQVVKLLTNLRKSPGSMGSFMFDYIEPTQFRAVVTAAQQCAGLNETDNE